MALGLREGRLRQVEVGVVEGSERDRGADLAGKVDARLDLARDEVGQSDHTVGLTQEMAL